jgi:hypothetical protein
MAAVAGRKTKWFPNPYQDYVPGLKDYKSDPVLMRKYALDLMDAVFAKGIEDGDGGLYVGAVGATYMYLHVAGRLSHEERQKYLPLAYKAFQMQAIFHEGNPAGRYVGNNEAAYTLDNFSQVCW